MKLNSHLDLDWGIRGKAQTKIFRIMIADLLKNKLCVLNQYEYSTSRVSWSLHSADYIVEN